MAELPKYDGDMTKQLEEAAAAGEVLRFVGGFHRVYDCIHHTALPARSCALLVSGTIRHTASPPSMLWLELRHCNIADDKVGVRSSCAHRA